MHAEFPCICRITTKYKMMMTKDVEACIAAAATNIGNDAFGNNNRNYNSTALNLFLLSHFMCLRLSLSMTMAD